MVHPCGAVDVTPLQHIRAGLHYRYPLCCVIWYALGVALGVRRQAVRRGSVQLSKGASYVPCCHWKHPNWQHFGSGRRLVRSSNILEF